MKPNNKSLKKPSVSIFTKALILCASIGCQTAPPIKTVHPVPQETSSPPPADAKNDENSNEKKEAPPTLATAIEVGPLTQSELEKYGYELGFDPREELTLEQKSLIEKRKNLRLLEKKLDSVKERLQYSKVLPWFKSDEEKVKFLSIPSIEGRQAWINKNKIWTRANQIEDYQEAVNKEDIILGMPADFVKRSWGEPEHIEVSGNPIYKNERWKYTKQVPSAKGFHQEKRLVYFEGGRVVGWETE